MPAHIRLQDVINISTSQRQEREYAVDVGVYNYRDVVGCWSHNGITDVRTPWINEPPD
jgi:hypothetical protein